MVSVWVGDFSSDVDLDDYLDVSRRFEHDFGFELNERDPPETCVNTKPTSVRELLKGFSRSKTYAEAVVELAKKQGVEGATTIVIFFNSQYDPSLAKPRKDALMQFLGSVSFS